MVEPGSRRRSIWLAGVGAFLVGCYGADGLGSALAGGSGGPGGGPPGSLDGSFGAGGQGVTPFGTGGDDATALAIQTDGKIVVAGHASNGSNTDIAVARYNGNGTLDATFDTDGRLTTAIGSSDDHAFGVALQSDGKIVAAGFSSNGSNNDFALVRIFP